LVLVVSAFASLEGRLRLALRGNARAGTIK
jgi:hypothetical protein